MSFKKQGLVLIVTLSLCPRLICIFHILWKIFSAYETLIVLTKKEKAFLWNCLKVTLEFVIRTERKVKYKKISKRMRRGQK